MFPEYMDPPSVSECITRCLKFAEITDTDSTLAMYYLQDADWDLHRSLYAFIPERGKRPFFPLDPKLKVAGNSSSEGNIETDKTALSCSNVEEPEFMADTQPVKSRNAESHDVNDKSERIKVIYERTNKQAQMGGYRSLDLQKGKDRCSNAEEPGFMDNTQPVKSRNAESHDVNDKSERIKEVCETANNFHIPIDVEPYRIRIMSWNIDGLDIDDIEVRVHGVCDTIEREKPHVVLLQEVVMEAQEILEEKCSSYDLIPAGDEGYYTAILLRWDITTLEDVKVMPFYTSRMRRNLLYVKCTVKGIKFDILTSHLESMKDRKEERKKQLKFAFDHVKLADIDRTVIFGGDLNLRDYELSEIGGLPEDVDDIWEVTGMRPETKFTWDVQRNDNLEWSSRYQPRLRFDRLYIRHCKPKAIVKPVHFELVGLERLQSCQKFPSDHWGLLSHFNVPSRMVQPMYK